MNVKLMSRIAVLASVMAFGALFAGRAATLPSPERVSLTGWLTCTTCLLPNTCKAQTRLSCVQQWIPQGASYVLVVGDKHFVLSGFEKELAKAVVANSVTIMGDLTGNQLTVASVDWNSNKHRER